MFKFAILQALVNWVLKLGFRKLRLDVFIVAVGFFIDMLLSSVFQNRSHELQFHHPISD